jgi:antagonist of KipI
MSIRIIKQGVFDTIQDAGRYGLQHLGINPDGAADAIAHAMANMLTGNEPNEAVIEMYYPSAAVLFEKDVMIAVSGADFSPCINGVPIPINSAVVVAAGGVLEFKRIVAGCCCCLAVKGGLKGHMWAGSYSTNIKAMAGGYKGRKLQTGDVIPFKRGFDFSRLLNDKTFMKPSWQADAAPLYSIGNIIRICKGNEFETLDDASKNLLVNSGFAISQQSDRMGCRLSGIPMRKKTVAELVSTGVTRGTIQLLPGGQLVILMAGHQTTGGYPRIAHVASADMPTLAQIQPGKTVNFMWTDEDEAEALLLAQHQYLQQLQIACNLRLEDFFNSHAHH